MNVDSKSYKITEENMGRPDRQDFEDGDEVGEMDGKDGDGDADANGWQRW